MTTIVYINQLATLLPALFLFLWHFRTLRLRDRAGEYILVVLSGAVTTIPTILLTETWASVAEDQSSGVAGIYFIFVHAFFVVALVEEFGKYLALQLTIGTSDAMNSLRNGMIFGAGASLGFALVENILYGATVDGPGQAIVVGLMRSITAVPVHGMAGAIIGYAISRSNIEKASPQKQLQIRMEGLGTAILLHGAYDFFLFLGGNWAWMVIPVLITMVIILSAHLNHARTDQGRQF